MDDEQWERALTAMDRWRIAALFAVMFGPTFSLLVFVAWGRISPSSLPLTALVVGLVVFLLWRPVIWLIRKGFLPRIIG
jgi:hypothetical protein